MTWYQDIAAVQPIMDLGVDSKGRSLFTFNVNITKKASDTLEEEMNALLTGAVVPSGRIFFSSKATLPQGDGPFLTVIKSGGFPPLRIHNSITPSYDKPTVQITARATSSADALAAAKAAFAILIAVRNRDVPPAALIL